MPSPAYSQISQQDRVVVVMGPTGVGKSKFVQQATGQDGKTVGRSWMSCTSEVISFRVKHHGQDVVFVDTPGFDHSDMSDEDILAKIADWLKIAYKGKANLAAILYLHRITDNRMSGPAMKNLRLFSSLCGQKAMPHVTIVTTMWSKVSKEEGLKWEEVLKREVWKDMLDGGCKSARFEDTYESAWNIVGTLKQTNSGATLRIQEELGDEGKSLNQTQASIGLHEATKNVSKPLLQRVRRGFSRLFG